MRKLSTLIGVLVLVAATAVPALAVTSTVNDNTKVVVNASITLTGVPALIDFGAGIPTDVKAATLFTMKVVTNNAIGYKVEVTTTNLVGASALPDTILASAVTYTVAAVGAGTAYSGSPTNGTTPFKLADRNVRSLGTGDDFNVTPSLLIPNVKSDTYNGTASFVASTL